MLKNGVRSCFEVIFVFGKMCLLIMSTLFIPGRIDLVVLSVFKIHYKATGHQINIALDMSQKLFSNISLKIVIWKENDTVENFGVVEADRSTIPSVLRV